MTDSGYNEIAHLTGAMDDAFTHIFNRLNGLQMRVGDVEHKLSGLNRTEVEDLGALVTGLTDRLKTVESIARDGVNKAQDVQHEVRSVIRGELSKMYEDYRSGLSRTEIIIHTLMERVAGLEKREAARAEKAVAEKIEPAGKHVYLLEGMDGERVDEVIGTYSTMLDAMEFVAWWNGARHLGTLGTEKVSWGWFANEETRQWICGRWRITELPHDSKFWDGDNGES